jgi:hypothetical protein
MRFLLSIPVGTSIDSLELAVIEVLDEAPIHDSWERSLLEGLRDLMRKVRRRGDFSKEEILLVDTRANRASAATARGRG